jgi:hypothetical protein
VEAPLRVKVAIGRPVEFGGIALERIGVPSGLVTSGSPYFRRALLLVTSGGLFRMVALGPAKWAMHDLAVMVE